MSNSNEEWWSVNGESLQRFGWAVTTVGGSRYDLPPRRGSNLAVAYRPGQIHRTKLPDQRVITLVMFMVGWNADTGPVIGQNPTLGDQRVRWNDNWDFLRRLVYRDYVTGSRVTLTRRWRLTAPDFPLVRDGDSIMSGDPGTSTPNVSRIVTASASAEMSGSMTPAMTGRTRSDFQLDFTLADPFFYGSQVTAELTRNEAAYIWNDGHDVAAHAGLTVDFNGPITNPVLTNLTTNPDSWVRLNTSIPANQTITLNVGRFSAQGHHFGQSSPVANRIAAVTSYGARMWVNLMPGANKLLLTADGNTAAGTTDRGYATLRFQPPYV